MDEILLKKYNRLLVEKNKVLNLTAHRDEARSWVFNVQDSLLFNKTIKNSPFGKGGGCAADGGFKLLDLGSGCGCPAIPLKIAYPELDVTMVDSVGKKVDFLNDVVGVLGLKNIRAVHSRIEDFSATARESYDIVTAKAVAELRTLVEYALPFLKVGGVLLAYKGKNSECEITAAGSALRELGGEVLEVKTAILRDGTEEHTRTLVIVKKVKPTPSKYPRGKNLPRVKPL